MHVPAQLHASCVARDGAGVLLLGPSGSGKSDLALRLLDRGFALVADDRTEIEGRQARAPVALRGLLEVRGLGILRLAWVADTRLALVVDLTGGAARLPEPRRHPTLGVPLVGIDPWTCSAAQRVALALDCALGEVAQVAGSIT